MHPGSQCPHCGHAIRARDNIPVLAWIWLRGRCRDCQSPISARYPTIELVVALLFASLGWVEVIQTGGAVAVSGVDSLPTDEWPFEWRCGIWAFHLLLLCTVLVVGLIQFDGLSVPRGIWYLALVAGVAAPIVWPWLLPATPREGGSPLATLERFQPAIGAAMVAAIALLVHSLVRRLKPSSGTSGRSALETMFLTLGISFYLGPRAGVAIVLASLLLCLGSGLLLKHMIPAALISVVIAWGWLLVWPALCDSLPLWGPGATLRQSLLLAGSGAVGIGLLASFPKHAAKP